MNCGFQEYLLYVDAFVQEAETLTQSIRNEIEMGRVRDFILEKAWKEYEDEKAALYDDAQSRLRLACACKSIAYKCAHPLFDRIMNLAICRQTPSLLYETP